MCPEIQGSIKCSQKSQPKLLVQRNFPFHSQFNIRKLFPQHLLEIKENLFKNNAKVPPLCANVAFHRILESSVRPEQQSLNVNVTIQD
jgi:hypothetical protein